MNKAELKDIKLEYKGYTGDVEFDEKGGIFHGRIQGIKDICSYEGVNIGELELDFKEAVEDYFEACESVGKKPQKPKENQVRLEKIASITFGSVIRYKVDSKDNLVDIKEEGEVYRCDVTRNTQSR